MVEQKQADFDKKLVPGSAKSFMKDSHSSSRDLWQVDVDLLRVLPGFNVRIKDAAYHEHVKGLADSMEAEGFYQDKPLAGYVAKEGDTQVIYMTDGHCRLDAVKIAIKKGAEILKIPVVVASAGSSMEDLTVALVRGNGGKPLTPMEIGIVCKRLIRFSWDVKEIARRLGFSTNYVEGLLLLMAAPAEVRGMVEAGEVSASVAIDTMKKHGDKAYEKLQASLEVAKAKGKDKVTDKHVSAGAFRKEVKKAATPLFITLREVKSDPAYASIDAELRKKLESLLAQLAGLDGVDEAVDTEVKKEQSKESAAAKKKDKEAAKTKKTAVAAKKAAAKKGQPSFKGRKKEATQ